MTQDAPHTAARTAGPESPAGYITIGLLVAAGVRLGMAHVDHERQQRGRG